MVREVLYIWSYVDGSLDKLSISKKVFEGENCVLVCTIEPISKPNFNCLHQGVLKDLFDQGLGELNAT